MGSVFLFKLRRGLTNRYLWLAWLVTLAVGLVLIFKRFDGTPYPFLSSICGWMLTPLPMAAFLMGWFREELSGRHALEALTMGYPRTLLGLTYLVSCALTVLCSTAVLVTVLAVAGQAPVDMAVRTILWEGLLLCCVAFGCMVCMLLLRNSMATFVPPALTVLIWDKLEVWVAGSTLYRGLWTGEGLLGLIWPVAAAALGFAVLFLLLFLRVEWK